jgi:hypothetical protein
MRDVVLPGSRLMGRNSYLQALLAIRRYKDLDPFTALMFFQSDRERAGLGALYKRTEHHPRVSNWKNIDPFTGNVTYHMRVHRPAGTRPVRLSAFVVCKELVPEISVGIHRSVTRNLLASEMDRSYVALVLRQARAELRREIEHQSNPGRAS